MTNRSVNYKTNNKNINAFNNNNAIIPDPVFFWHDAGYAGTFVMLFLHPLFRQIHLDIENVRQKETVHLK